MAKILEHFINFESGTLYELAGTVFDVGIVTDPVPPYKHETYTMLLPSFGDVHTNIAYIRPVPHDQNKYAVGFYVRFHKVGSIHEQFFFRWGYVDVVNGWDFHLRLEDDGAFSIYDNNEAHVATSSTGVFAANTDHLVEFLLTRGNPGDLIIHVDKNEVLNTNGENYDSVGVYVYSAMFMTQSGVSPELVTIHIPGMYIYSGADTVADFVGIFGSLTFRHDENSVIPDIGDNLNVGTWADGAEVPFSDANFAQYTISGRKGIVTTDPDGCVVATPGPYGDGRIKEDDIILGASWLFRYLASLFTTGRLYYGDTPWFNPGVDNTVFVAMSSSGTILNKLIISDDAADVPSINEYFQYGFGGTALMGMDARLYDCLCSLLIKVAPPMPMVSDIYYRRRVTC